MFLLLFGREKKCIRVREKEYLSERVSQANTTSNGLSFISCHPQMPFPYITLLSVNIAVETPKSMAWTNVKQRKLCNQIQASHDPMPLITHKLFTFSLFLVSDLRSHFTTENICSTTESGAESTGDNSIAILGREQITEFGLLFSSVTPLLYHSQKEQQKCVDERFFM